MAVHFDVGLIVYLKTGRMVCGRAVLIALCLIPGLRVLARKELPDSSGYAVFVRTAS